MARQKKFNKQHESDDFVSDWSQPHQAEEPVVDEILDADEQSEVYWDHL